MSSRARSILGLGRPSKEESRMNTPAPPYTPRPLPYAVSSPEDNINEAITLVPSQIELLENDDPPVIRVERERRKTTSDQGSPRLIPTIPLTQGRTSSTVSTVWSNESIAGSGSIHDFDTTHGETYLQSSPHPHRYSGASSSSYNQQPQPQHQQQHQQQARASEQPVERETVIHIQQAIEAAEAIFKCLSDYSKFPGESDSDREIRLLNMRVHSGDLIRKTDQYIKLLRRALVINDLEERSQMTLIMKLSNEMQSNDSPVKLFKFWKEMKDTVIKLHHKLAARHIELGIQGLVIRLGEIEVAINHNRQSNGFY